MDPVPSALAYADILAELRQAWSDSRPATAGAHEIGGFVLRDAAGRVRISRWPSGLQNSIVVPTHTGCMAEGCQVIATFHTHPNVGADFLQEPSDTDVRAVSGDADLKAPWYEGELVVADRDLYLILPNGGVLELGARQDVLGGC